MKAHTLRRNSPRNILSSFPPAAVCLTISTANIDRFPGLGRYSHIPLLRSTRKRPEISKSCIPVLVDEGEKGKEVSKDSEKGKEVSKGKGALKEELPAEEMDRFMNMGRINPNYDKPSLQQLKLTLETIRAERAKVMERGEIGKAERITGLIIGKSASYSRDGISL